MKRKNQGFTLVEILIVVVILGILAAIVIPQFSEASTEAKVNSVASSLQTLRSQISLYKIQHNDTPPTLASFQADAASTGTGQMTGKTLISGTVDAAGTYGPYLQSVPNNPFNNSNSLAAADATTVGWVYDASDGSIDCAVTDAPADLQATLGGL
ncbi:MAG: competence type IV pilus major pilin ComGC [Planctomycetota bacterium]|jgi:general secretion pathway protein G